MYSSKNLKSIYNKSKNDLKKLIKYNSLNETNIEALISNLYLDNQKYSYSSINSLLKSYINMMKNSFDKDKNLFYIQFALYLHIIELTSFLCKRLSLNKTRRDEVPQILQILTESKNMLKLYIPLNQNFIDIINNIIGQHLYKFTHINYLNANKKDIDYILEYYIYSCEKIIDGYELSLSTNFGNNPKINKKLELIKVKNNLTFLLLTMHYKIDFYFPDICLREDNIYIQIFDYIKELSFFNKKIIIKNFKEFLLDEFKKSSEKLIINNKKYYYKEKISILNLNTDEYKELIDIITRIK